jgi:Small protein A (tmRNA-binding)
MVLFLGLTACQTSMVKQFDKVKLGMEKDDILEIMGTPSQAQRFHGKDRWKYVFYDKRIRFEKEVHFFEGNAVYIGDKFEPPVELSAAKIDQKNEIANQAAIADEAKEVQAARKAYSSYEEEMRGNDRVRFVPQYVPVGNQ